MEEKFWKITNLTNTPVKITVCVKSNMAPGLILQPNQFCIGKQQMTSPLDKQAKTKMVSIEEFDNTYLFELAKAYDKSFLDKEKDKVKNYVK